MDFVSCRSAASFNLNLNLPVKSRFSFKFTGSLRLDRDRDSVRTHWQLNLRHLAADWPPPASPGRLHNRDCDLARQVAQLSDLKQNLNQAHWQHPDHTPLH
eukprot:961787-Rhodomonas_salina.1